MTVRSPYRLAGLAAAAALAVLAAWVPALLAPSLPTLPAYAPESLAAFRWIALGLAAVLALTAALPRRLFAHPGLAPAVTGLRLGPARPLPAADRREVLALVALVGLGAVLRVVRLDTDLWLDEIATLVDYMRAGLLDNLFFYGAANHHILNSLLGHVSIAVLGEAAWTVRLPAVLFGIAGLPACYYLARALTDRREAFLATLLLALSYHHIWFSQNARGYTAMIFFMLLGTGLYVRALARNRTGTWVLYGVVMSLGVWSLLNTAFVIAGHGLAYAALWLRRAGRRVDHRPLLARLGATGAATALGILFLHSLALPAIVAYYTGGGTEMGWTDPLGFVRVVLAGLSAGLGAVGLLAVAVGGGLVLAGTVSYARQSPLVLALLALPAVLNVVALVVLQFGAYPRSFLYVLPFLLLLVVRGLFVTARFVGARWTGMPVAPRRLATAATLALALVSAASLAFLYRYPKQDYTGALAYARAHAGEGERICAVGYARTSYQAYHGPELCFPETVEALHDLRRTHGVWVLYSFPRDMRRHFAPVYDHLQEQFELVATFPGTLGDGYLYVTHAAPSASTVHGADDR